MHGRWTLKTMMMKKQNLSLFNVLLIHDCQWIIAHLVSYSHTILFTRPHLISNGHGFHINIRNTTTQFPLCISLSHPGIVLTLWPHFNLFGPAPTDIQQWLKNHLPYQWPKIYWHVRLSLGTFTSPDRFNPMHFNILNLISPSACSHWLVQQLEAPWK